MSTLVVPVGGSIQAAIDAAAPGDTIDVPAGSYVDQFLTIETSITLQATGGMVVLTEDTQPPDGKAYITEGQPGLTVAINGFDISGVTVPDNNGAAVRYEGGNLSLSNDYFHNDQDGLLGAADPNGSISIDHGEFAFNGDGSGSTHNIYVGAIADFSITNSYVHDAVVGHEIKSRAANNIITNDRIFDNAGTASYSIDLPNGGDATISGDVIEQGPNSQNPAIIAYGEEGHSNPGATVAMTGDTIVNDRAGGTFALDPDGTPVVLTGDAVFGLTLPGATILATRPTLDLAPIAFITPPANSPASPPPPPTLPPPRHHGGGHHFFNSHDDDDPGGTSARADPRHRSNPTPSHGDTPMDTPVMNALREQIEIMERQVADLKRQNRALSEAVDALMQPASSELLTKNMAHPSRRK